MKISTSLTPVTAQSSSIHHNHNHHPPTSPSLPSKSPLLTSALQSTSLSPSSSLSPRSNLAASISREPRELASKAAQISCQLSELAFTHATTLIHGMQGLQSVIHDHMESLGNQGSALGLLGQVEGLERKIIKSKVELDSWAARVAPWFDHVFDPFVYGFVEDLLKIPFYLDYYIEGICLNGSSTKSSNNGDSSKKSKKQLVVPDTEMINNNNTLKGVVDPMMKDLELIMDVFQWVERLAASLEANSNYTNYTNVNNNNTLNSSCSTFGGEIIKSVVVKESCNIFHEKFLPLILDPILEQGNVTLPIAMKIVTFLKKVPFIYQYGSTSTGTNSNQILDSSIGNGNSGQKDSIQAYYLKRRLATISNSFDFSKSSNNSNNNSSNNSSNNSNNSNNSNALKHEIQRVRQILFDVITQYSALFPTLDNEPIGSDNNKLNNAILSRIIHSHALGPFLERFEIGLKGINDVASLYSVIILARYLAVSLARLGFDFSGKLLDPLESNLVRIITSLHDIGMEMINAKIKDYYATTATASTIDSTNASTIANNAKDSDSKSFNQSPNITTKSTALPFIDDNQAFSVKVGEESEISKSTSTSTSTSTSSSSSVKISSPSTSLLSAPIYALYANTIVSILNEVRQCPLISLKPYLLSMVKSDISILEQETQQFIKTSKNGNMEWEKFLTSKLYDTLIPFVHESINLLYHQ